MTARRTKFYLDKPNARLSGVCSGIADYTGFDLFLVRMGFCIPTHTFDLVFAETARLFNLDTCLFAGL